MEKVFYCLTFDSTHYAIKTEKKLKLNNIDGNVIPTPREISSSCGLSIKFFEDNLDVVESLLDEEDLERIKLYKINRIDEKNRSERLEWKK